MAFRVFVMIDTSDQIEAEIASGKPLMPIEMLNRWADFNAFRLLSVVAVTGDEPFAVLGVNLTAHAGVAEAALLACNHSKYRRQIGWLGAEIRRRLPDWAAENQIRRIEARSWVGHPTAGGFLTVCGFTHECDLGGYGPTGRDSFNQFAWLAANQEEK